MNVGAAFVANAQASELMQPSDGALHHPTGHAQATAVLGVAASNLGANAAGGQRPAVRLGVIAAVGLDHIGTVTRRARFTGDRRNAVDQGQQLRNIVAVGLGENDRQGNALGIREEMVFRARFTAIGWVRSSFFPPWTARTEELSATARAKSSLSAWRNFASNTRCNRSQTPACCQSRSRRQQVIPEPHPISLGSISQGIPDCSTNRIPVSIRRSESGRRPGYRLRRRRRGNRGSITAHHRSSTKGFGIALAPGHAMPISVDAKSHFVRRSKYLLEE